MTDQPTNLLSNNSQAPQESRAGLGSVLVKALNWCKPRAVSGSESASISHDDIVQALYRGILGRRPDESGRNSHLASLEKGRPLHKLIERMILSEEFKARIPLVKKAIEDEKAEFDYTKYEDIITALYAGIFGREPDEGGFKSNLAALQGGDRLSTIIEHMIASEEFDSIIKSKLNTAAGLPDLTKLYPDKYSTAAEGGTIFNATADSDFAFMESLIEQHSYYESFGVWTPSIDLDKKITAAIAQGLGAKNCLELGCFTGPVLSVLAQQGVDVCGVELSHLALALAYPNIRKNIRYGDLLNLEFNKSYDVFLAMDVLEHLSPLKIDQYIKKIARLVKASGFIYVNSPMFGPDDIFGTVAEANLAEWQKAGDTVFWRQLLCDSKGWPLHGHLIWASPKWWEKKFSDQGLVRDRQIELAIHSLLAGFFKDQAPARRTFFVLKHANAKQSAHDMIAQLKTHLAPLIGTENRPTESTP